MNSQNNDSEHLDKFYRPIEVGNVIAHGGESGPSVGVVTRLTSQKIEMKRLCVVEEHIEGTPWCRENTLVQGYYWSKTMLNSAERCIILPLTERDLVADLVLSLDLGRVENPAEAWIKSREVTEISANGTVN